MGCNIKHSISVFSKILLFESWKNISGKKSSGYFDSDIKSLSVYKNPKIVF